MKFSLSVFLCFFFNFGITAQTAEIIDDNTVKVETITLMRDDGTGDPGAETEVFKTSDRPIHFQIQLDSFMPVMVRMVLATADVKGLKAGTKILTISYKTNGEQNIVNFMGSPKAAWLAGNYRVEVYINNKLSAEKRFEIEKPLTSPPQNNFSPPKPKAKRKN